MSGRRFNVARNHITRREFLKAGGALAGGAFLSSGLIGQALAGERDGGKPNVIMLCVDTLRADHCSCYGYKRETTPFLDRMAKEGTRFSQYISPSCWTTPSIMSMFTGLSPIRHGVVTTRNVLADSVPTLPGLMRDLGYHTIGVLCNPCAAGKMGFDHGFDLYDDFTILLDSELNLFDVGGGKKKRIHESATSKRITDLALRHAQKVPEGKPLFLFVLYYDPHGNYVPEGKYASMFTDPAYAGKADGRVYNLPDVYRYETPADLAHVVGLYDGEIRQTDDEVARLMGALKKAGIWTDDDLLVLTSDHGEEFCDHGGLKHGRTLYEEVVHVPLVLRWPGKIPAGTVVNGLTEHRDLCPTILNAVGGKAREGMDGIDLIATANGGVMPDERAVGMHVQAQGHLTGWRTDHWSVFLDRKTGKVEAYDLAKDPKQTEPIVQAGNREAEALLAAMNAWVKQEEALFAEHAPKGKDAEAKLTRQQIKALKAMGYIH